MNGPRIIEPADETGASRRSILGPVVGVTIVWLTALGLLAMLTANPVTLNEQQIRQSEIIVSAQFSSADPLELTVGKVWPPETDTPQQIRLRKDQKLDVNPGISYLVPLQRTRSQEFIVTRAILAGMTADGSYRRTPPYIYPDDPAARTQLREMMKRHQN